MGRPGVAIRRRAMRSRGGDGSASVEAGIQPRWGVTRSVDDASTFANLAGFQPIEIRARDAHVIITLRLNRSASERNPMLRHAKLNVESEDKG